MRQKLPGFIRQPIVLRTIIMAAGTVPAGLRRHPSSHRGAPALI